MNETEDKPKEGESWLEFFKRHKMFADLILMAWSTSEFFMNQLFTKQFNVYFDYPEAKILVDMTFNRKLEYLKKFGVFSNEEFQTIKKFQEFRNKLFHGSIPEYITWTESKKEKVMDEAIQATNIIRDALVNGRKIKKQSDERIPKF